MITHVHYPASGSLQARMLVLMQALVAHVTRRTWEAASDWHGVLIPVAIANLINAWVTRRQGLIVRLLARIEAGAQRDPRPDDARAPLLPAAEEGRVRKAPAQRVPPLFGWLSELAQEVRNQGMWLRTLLAEEELRAKMEAHPQLARLIRPVLRALAEREPEWMKPLARQGTTTRRRSMRRGAGRSPQSGGEDCSAPAGPKMADDASAALARLVVETRRRRMEAHRPIRPMWNGDTHPPTRIDGSPPNPARPDAGMPAAQAAASPHPAGEEWWRRRYRIILASRPAGI